MTDLKWPYHIKNAHSHCFLIPPSLECFFLNYVQAFVHSLVSAELHHAIA